MKLFVTGASGFIGSRFCAMALERDHLVTAMVRPSSAARIPAGVKRVYGTLPYDIPAAALNESDTIVHLAAITTSQQAAESQAVNELGTEFLLKLAKKAGCAFIFTSTQSAHGDNASAYATTKRRCEEMIRVSPLQWAVLRPGLVYGPGENGLYARMRQTVRRLPVLPLLGGGKALVQPIHVDDLCTAILTILEDLDKYTSAEYNLGDANGISLKDFLRQVSVAEGKRPFQIAIPLALVKAAVAMGEALRVPLPVSMDNLRGLETVKRMDTKPSLTRLGLSLRNLEDGIRQSAQSEAKIKDDRTPILLVGAGKIGIVHGLQILHNPNARLVGIVEPNARAAKLYRSMGFNVPFHDSVEAALACEPAPQAALVATPADTHLAVARKCLEASLHVLVEKPLSVNTDIAEEWRQLQQSHPNMVIHSGYMAAQFPHLLTAFHMAGMNKLGHIYKARLVALQTHIMAPEPVRWEMLKDRAGGGVMINFGCHVASMLFRLLGWPDSNPTGWQWPIYSTEVEDAIVAKFQIKSTQCTLAASWSVSGYARPYNLVELECERGTLRVENSCIYVIQDGMVTLMQTQLDHDLSFNMSPDYTGGGFTLEHAAFTNSIHAHKAGRTTGSYKTDFMPPVEMPEALRLETWIRNLYENLQQGKPTPAQIREYGLPEDVTEKLLSAGEQTI